MAFQKRGRSESFPAAFLYKKEGKTNFLAAVFLENRRKCKKYAMLLQRIALISVFA